MRYRVDTLADDPGSGRIELSPRTAKLLRLSRTRVLSLAFGLRQEEVLLEVMPDVPDNRLRVDPKLLDYLLVDLRLEYELARVGNTLILGPTIGLLLSEYEERLLEVLEEKYWYPLIYEQLGGALYIITHDLIDFEQGTVQGYLHVPGMREALWTRTRLPLPRAMIRRIDLALRPYKWTQIKRVMGERVFNNYFFNKLEYWEWLRDDPVLGSHLPETTEDVSKSSIDRFLERYGKVYLKPHSASGGLGIHLIERVGSHRYRVRKNYEEKDIELDSPGFERFLRPFVRVGRHVLQQPVATQLHDGRHVCYRVIEQRDDEGTWRCTGFVGLFGGRGMFTSNFRDHGFGIGGEQALRKQFGDDDVLVFRLSEQLKRMGRQVAHIVDKLSGPYVNLGIDMVLDRDRKVWVLEVNKRQNYFIPLNANEPLLFYEAICTPLKYAKKVSMA